MLRLIRHFMNLTHPRALVKTPAFVPPVTRNDPEKPKTQPPGNVPANLPGD